MSSSCMEVRRSLPGSEDAKGKSKSKSSHEKRKEASCQEKQLADSQWEVPGPASADEIKNELDSQH
jgi:hypothetical protein